MAEVATEPAGFGEAPQGASLAQSSPSRPEGEGVGIHRPLRARDRLLRGGVGRRPRSRAARARPCCRWPRPSSPTPELLEERLGALVPAEDPFVARNEAGWRDGVLVHVPAGVEARRADPGRGPARRGRRRGRLAHPDRPRGGRRGRGLGALLLGRRRDRRAAQLGGRAARRPGGDPALRQHPGHLRARLDLRHPARPGRARRPPRLDRARLRLGPRQGADGDQARRAGLRGAGHRRLRRRARAAPRLRHHPGARGARTPTPTSPSAASSPPARPRSGAG